MVKFDVGDYFNLFSEDYDSLASEFEWSSPKKIFNLISRYDLNKKNILDLGIGSGLSSLPYLNISNVYGLDLSDKLLDIARSRGFKNVEVLDFENSRLPFPNNFFNYIISSGVFCYLSNLENVIEESIRVIKKKGHFIFTIEDLELNGGLQKDNFAENEYPSIRYSKKDIMNFISEKDFSFLDKKDFLAYYSPVDNVSVYYSLYHFKKI